MSEESFFITERSGNALNSNTGLILVNRILISYVNDFPIPTNHKVFFYRAGGRSLLRSE